MPAPVPDLHFGSKLEPVEEPVLSLVVARAALAEVLATESVEIGRRALQKKAAEIALKKATQASSHPATFTQVELPPAMAPPTPTAQDLMDFELLDSDFDYSEGDVDGSDTQPPSPCGCAQCRSLSPLRR